MQKVLTIAELLTILADDVQNVVEIQAFSQNNPDFCIDNISSLETATQSSLSFLANPRYQSELNQTKAGAVLLNTANQPLCPDTSLAIIVKNPYLSFAKLTKFFAYQTNILPDIHPTAVIADTAKIGKNAVIGAYCVIGENVEIGDDCRLDSHVVVEDFVKIGQQCELKSYSFIGHHCQLGDFVILHSHASIGNEGFGYAPRGLTNEQGWQKIHQLGRVVIGNHVRIGSQTCVDRGALGDTVIGNHVIVDNLVQIAHNVAIGDGTVISGCVGIAGSTKIGKRCVLAGGVGLVGHIEICDDVTITGMTMVTKSIVQKGSYSSGTPMLPTSLWKKMAIKIKQLAKDEQK